MSVQDAGLVADEPFVVSPRRAYHLLDCGMTRLYELIAAGELQSFRDGSSRKIVLGSIRDYVAKKLSQTA